MSMLPVRWLPLDAIRPSPYQARRSADDAGLQDLAASIRDHGLIQPVIVRPVSSGFELVAGERRWRAAGLAGLEMVPALVREVSDREAAVLSLIENLQREDLHFFDEAEGYQQLIDEFRLTQEELAQQIGRSQAAVANKLRLLKLDEATRAIISREMLSERHARALLRLPDGDARSQAAVVFARRGMNVAQAEAWVERHVAGAGAIRRRAPKVVIRDLRIIFNNFRHTVRYLRENGFHAELEEQEEPDAWVVRLRISKRRRAK